MKQDMKSLAKKYGFQVMNSFDVKAQEKYGVNIFAMLYDDKICVDTYFSDENSEYIIALILAHYKLEGLDNPNYRFMYTRIQQIINEKKEIIKMANEMINEDIKDNILLFRRKL